MQLPSRLVSESVIRSVPDTREQRGKIIEPLGDDVDDAALALDLPAHPDHRGAKHNPAMLLEDVGPYDQVRDFSLVLERDEHDALGGAWLLPDQHDAREVDPSTILDGLKLLAADHLARAQLVAKEGEGVRSQREARGAVILNYLCAFAHGCEDDGGFDCFLAQLALALVCRSKQR